MTPEPTAPPAKTPADIVLPLIQGAMRAASDAYTWGLADRKNAPKAQWIIDLCNEVMDVTKEISKP